MTAAYIGLGSNLGDRAAALEAALEKLRAFEPVEVVDVSEFIETEPLGPADQPFYLNAAAKLETSLEARQLLDVLKGIEDSLGRTRQRKWGERILDLDLLMCGGMICCDERLTLPHPEMHLRAFVLDCLAQIEPELVHPLLGVSMRELAGRVNGGNFFRDASRPQLISVAGVIGVGKTTLAGNLAEKLGCEMLPEPYDTNPFLAAVYAGKSELALDSELYFLAGRMEQLDRRRLAGGRVVVSDYAFGKQPIYACRLLDEQQYALYERLSPPMRQWVAEPVVVVHLHDTAARCLERIHSRNRPYEQQITEEFLQGLGDDYDMLFERWGICPVIRLSVSEFDCRADGDLNWLADQIRYYIAAGQ